MAIKSSGQLSFTEIVAEFPDTTPHSMSEFYRGAGKVGDNNLNIPTSGTISFSNFYGASAEAGNIWYTTSFYNELQSLYAGTWGQNHSNSLGWFDSNTSLLYVSLRHTDTVTNEPVSQLLFSPDYGLSWLGIPEFRDFLVSTWPAASYDDADVNSFAYNPSLNLVLGVPVHYGTGPGSPYFLIRSTQPESFIWTNNNTAASNLALALRENVTSGVSVNALFITRTSYGFCACERATNKFAISTDGITWTQIPTVFGYTSSIISLQYVNGKIICCYEPEYFYTTPRGIIISNDEGQTWTNYSKTVTFIKIIYNGTYYIGITDRGWPEKRSNSYYYSTDAINWTERAGQFNSSTIISDVVYNGSKTIIVTQETSAPFKARLYVSSDGLSWTEKTNFYTATPTMSSIDYPNLYSYNSTSIFVNTSKYGLFSSN